MKQYLRNVVLLTNPGYILALAMFSVAVLINIPSELFLNPTVFVLVVLLNCILFISVRFWHAAAAVTLINLVLFAYRFPRTTNHSNLEMFVAALIIGLLIVKYLRPTFTIPRSTVSLLFRVTAVCIYFYTGFHKLNTGFLHPEGSCVNHINNIATTDILALNIPYSVGSTRLLQLSTLLLELVVPWGLLWHRTRKYSAIILLCFHFYLSFLTLANFGSFAAFLIFGCLFDFQNGTVSGKLRTAFRRYLGFGLLAIVIVHILYKAGISIPVARCIFGAVYNIGFLTFFIVFFREFKTVPTRYRMHGFAAATAVAILFSLWSLKTYAGLGNIANLTMYSNLLTEQSRSNHLLIDTRKTKFTHFEEDNLKILKFDKRQHAAYYEGHRLPVIEFRYVVKRYIKKYPNEKLECTIVYKNDTIHIPDLKTSQFANSKWWYKYLYFRRIPDEDTNPCLW